LKYSALKSQDRVLVSRCGIAESFVPRFLGLMGRRSLSGDEGLLFPRCNSIHTFFMRFPIDVVFLDAQGKVLTVIEALRPWRMLLPRLSAKHCLELAAHRSRELGIETGMKLQIQGALV